MITTVGQASETDEPIASASMSIPSGQQLSSPSLDISVQSSAEFNELLVENLGGKGRVSMKKFTSSYRKFFHDNFGPVSHFYVVKYHRAWQSKGYGYVTFENSEDAQKVLNATEEQLTVDVKSIMGSWIQEPHKRTLKVSPAEETVRSRVCNFVKNREELNNQRAKEREELISKLISGEVEREKNNEDEDCDPCGFHSLTDDIIRNILCNLNSVELDNCASVCRRWYDVVQDIQQHKRSIYIDKLPQTDQSEEFNEHIFTILKKYPNLKELGIARSYYIDEVTVEIIGLCCPKLERISSMYSAATLVEDLAQHCPGLKAIDLHDWRHLKDKTLSELLKVAHNLKDLNLSGRNEITGECFSQFPELEILDIRGCKNILTGSMAKLAKKCHSSLKILKVGPISQKELSVIWESFPNLHTLELQNVKKSILSKVFKIIPKFEKLESLYIYPENKIEDEIFIRFLESCRNLKELRLPCSYCLTGEGFSKLADFCKDLRCLDLSSSMISDLDIESFHSLNFLERLLLAETEVTDDGLKGILTGCSNLNFLDVDECREVTVETLLTAYGLKTQELLNRQLIIKYRGELVKMNDLKTQQGIFELEEELDYQLECEEEDESHDSFDYFFGNHFYDHYFGHDDSDEFYDEDSSDALNDEDDSDEFDDEDDLEDSYDEEDSDELDDEDYLESLHDREDSDGYYHDSDEFSDASDLDDFYNESNSSESYEENSDYDGRSFNSESSWETCSESNDEFDNENDSSGLNEELTAREFPEKENAGNDSDDEKTSRDEYLEDHA